MRALVVYESLFGNTREVARAIGDGIREARPGARVDVLSVDEAPRSPAGFDLVVVGGPLVTGEADRARAWGHELAHTLTPADSPTT